MRTYEKTHPWIKFSVNLSQVHPQLWINLGECKSKCEHISGVPLRPTTAKELHQLYLAKGVLATTAIEGNTLSEEEVLKHLEGKLKLPPSREYLAQEIDNIIKGCNQITDAIASGSPPSLCLERIKELNAIVLEKLQFEEGVIPGQIRKYSVGVARYRGAPWEDCEYLVGRLCEWLNGEDFKSRPGGEIIYAIIKAVVCHLYLAWIHPFGDGNGRTARLVEFQILIASGVPAPAAHLLSNHYNLTRSEYYRQLDQASRSGGEILPFINYAVQGFLDGLRSQLEIIRDQQWDIVWRNYVHEQFRARTKTASQRRQRELILELSRKIEPTPFPEIRLLSPAITEAYARKTSKTLQRDINALIKMGLAEKTSRGVRAKKEIILSYLPVKAEDAS